MTTTASQPPAATRSYRLSGHWIDHWEPEDPTFWETTGRGVARRNLAWSIFAEHIGFSVWTLFSVMVLFMGKQYGMSAADKFLMVATATAVGSVIRVPYTFGPARFGGRNWTIFSALMLMVPTILLAIVMKPGTSLATFLVVAAIAGVGGGNFASSMANINAFYPEGRKGLALGLNAGGGNLGVAVVQIVGLIVIGSVGLATPQLVLYIYLPLIVAATVGAALFMDNLTTARNDTKAVKEILREPQTYVMSFLYIGTFGSFIGYSFAFGLVLQNQFGRTPLQAAALTFLGPLLGSFSRPPGGWLSDKIGGALVTLGVFIGLAVGTGVVILANNLRSLPLFLVGFITMFVLTGIGNGSTYKMIPAIFRSKAKTAIAEGADETTELLRARRLSGALIGIAGAVGALGGLFINLAFRSSFQTTGSGTTAFAAFLVFYTVCGAVTYAVYLRKVAIPSGARELAYAGI
ncbi:MAG TPA: nitrate/nitrite transporter [Pseudonocardiaceae bacterium]